MYAIFSIHGIILFRYLFCLWLDPREINLDDKSCQADLERNFEIILLSILSLLTDILLIINIDHSLIKNIRTFTNIPHTKIVIYTYVHKH